MRNRTRKSSARVTLVLLGAAVIAGCGDSATVALEHRDVYASKEDCLADWRDPKECEEGLVQDSGARRRSYWYGPTYSSGSSWGGGYHAGAPRPGSSALGTHSTTRGGFGGSGASHGASGS
jgi:hypothetical protein